MAGMAGTVATTWNDGMLRGFEGNPTKDATSLPHPAYTHSKYRAAHESLMIHGFGELRGRAPAVATKAPALETLEKTPPHDALFCTDEVAAFISSLRACAKKKDLRRGTWLHDAISERGLLEKCADALVTMYAKCGALAQAQRLLDTHRSRNVSSWTSLIAGYAKQGQGHAALECYEQMKLEGVAPDAFTFSCILKACGTIRALEKGERFHDEAVREGWLKNSAVLGTALVDMYVKCGAMAKAQAVLEGLSSQDNFTWSALIAGYAQQGQGEQALMCFERMKEEGLSPTAATYTCVLKACSSIGAIDKGKETHDDVVREGLLKGDIVLGNALVDMYAKCGDLVKARRVLEELPSRDVVSWSTIIAGYANQGQGEQALHCYEEMRHEGLFPNPVTYVSILKACGSIRALDTGKQIHREITRQGLLGENIALGTALVDMYARCEALSKAQEALEELVIQDVSSWNALIAGCVEHSRGEQALDCFKQMQREGLAPDAVTFASILKACGSVGALDKGHEVYNEIVRQGCLVNNVVLGNALVDMYVKCGALAEARHVLKKLPARDVITWSSLIAGYAEQGLGEEALDCFDQMRREGLSPNALTFTCILKACGHIGAADMGKLLHREISQRGLLGKDTLLGSALVDMYANSGALAKAHRVLEGLSFRDVNSWNALMAGYAQQGRCEEARNCFERMQHEGVFPDGVTFSNLLNACSHQGMVDDSHTYFVDMSSKYGMMPSVEHYSCMVDLFGRAGHLDNTITLMQKIPYCPPSAVWTAFLSACCKWGDVNVGRWAFKHAVCAQKSDEAAFVLLANVYTVSGMQMDAKSVEARVS